MLIFMRTTLVIDDALFKEAKQAAAKAGCTLSEFVNRAIGAALAERARPRTSFEMIVYGGGGPEVRHEPGDFSDAIDDEDRRSLEG